MDIEKRPAPRVLAPALLRELAEENPLGLRLTPEEVGAWWELTWTAYKTHGYKLHGKAIRSWWSRLTYVELDRARTLLRSRSDEALRRQEERIRHEDSDLRAYDPVVMRAIFGRR